MSENSYQNQDLETPNPLRVSIGEDLTSSPPITNKSTSPLKSALQTSKIKLLIILSVIVAILFVLSILITIFRSIRPTPRSATTTPTPIITPLPTDITDNERIPADFKTKFNQVDNDSRININFNPPQIDPNIGL